jgi:hypothetical protein
MGGRVCKICVKRRKRERTWVALIIERARASITHQTQVFVRFTNSSKSFASAVELHSLHVVPVPGRMGKPVTMHGGALTPHPAHTRAHSGVDFPQPEQFRDVSPAFTDRSIDTARTHSFASSRERGAMKARRGRVKF